MPLHRTQRPAATDRRLVCSGRLPIVLVAVTAIGSVWGSEAFRPVASPGGAGASSVARHPAGVSGPPWLILGPPEPAVGTPNGAAAHAPQAVRGDPLSLAAGDFDEDGVDDLAVGFGNADGTGSVEVWQGNADAIYPNAPAAIERRAAGVFSTAPFRARSTAFEAPVRAEAMAAGDFDADGHLDLVVARYGDSRLVHLAGDGRGGFASPRAVSLPGALTALAVGDVNRRDGLTDLAVGVDTPQRPQLLIFEGPEGALRSRPEAFHLAGAPAAIALGQLDDDSPVDVAVAAGHELVLVHGRDRRLSFDRRSRDTVPPAHVERRGLPFAVGAVASADLAGDARQELALLDVEGRVHVLCRAGATDLAAWNLTDTDMVMSDAAGAGRNALLLRAHTASLPLDGLVVGGGEAPMVVTGGLVPAEARMASTAQAPAAPARIAAPLTLTGDRAVAVLPMRLNADALDDLVVLGATGAVTVQRTLPTASFVVNRADHGRDVTPGDGHCDADAAASGDQCTFYAAIEESNALAGMETITFSVPVVDPEQVVPAFTGPVTVDGTSLGRVELRNKAAQPTLRGGSSVLRGLVIRGGQGFGVSISGASGSIVEGCFIGTDASGAVAAPNRTRGVSISESGQNIVGGTAASALNVISGNGGNGVDINAAPSSQQCAGNRVIGNHVGVDVSGLIAVPNTAGGGVHVSNCPNTTVGGSAAGEGNLISANVNRGVYVYGTSGGTLIQGNRIGTDLTGTVALGNGSPNGYAGVDCYRADAVGIGGTSPSAGNVIAANASEGVLIQSATATGTLVQGNLIGTDVSGTAALGNGAVYARDGVRIVSSPEVQVGGTALGAANVIAANSRHGVNIYSEGGSVTGNLIGVGKDGASPLGNGSAGVYAAYGARIEANTIRHNGGAGVTVVGAQHVTVTRNSIDANDGLGIDLNGNGRVEVNDAGDADIGANGNQNYPVLTTGEGGSVSGALDSTPSTAFTVELFASPACDPSGNGEGETFLGETSVTTDAAGHASFPVAAGGASGAITATATDPDGSTSEFSACLAAGASAVTVASITPSVAPNIVSDSTYFTEPLQVTITGEGFKRHASTTVALVDPAGGGSPTATVSHFQGCDASDICTAVVASLTGFANLPEGPRDVVVTNNDGRKGTGAGLFFVSSLYVPPLEVNQALPDASSDCTTTRPCIANHNTTVRVRVTCAGAGCAAKHPALVGRLHVSRGGQPIPGSPFTPTDNPSIDAATRGQDTLAVRATGDPYPAVQRKRALDTLSFVFASTLTGSQPAPGGDYPALGIGDYDLAFEVDPRSSGSAPAAATLPDSSKHLLRRSNGLRFSQAPPKAEIELAVLVEGNAPADVADVLSRFGFLRAAYPTDPGLVTFRYFQSDVAYASWTPTFKNAHIRRTFYLLRQWWMETVKRQNDWTPSAVLLFSSAVRTDDGSGVSDCMDVPGGWRCDSPTSYIRLPAPAERGDVEKTIAHEVGHHLGLGDTYADGLVSPVNQPGTSCYANGCTVEDKAFDSLLFRSSAPEPRLADPNDTLSRDFMGNAKRTFSWVDRRTWDYLYGRFMSAGSTRAPVTPLRATEYLTVDGLIGEDGSAELGTVIHSPAPLAPTPPTGSYVLELQDAGGHSLASQAFDPSQRLVHVEQPFHASFLVSLPFEPQASRLVLREGTHELVSRIVSANPPVVHLTSPNGGEALSGQVTVRWTASDADGDPLTFSVLYAPTGEPATPLALGLTATSFTWNTAMSAGTSSGRVIVVASDGILESEDSSDAPFAVADKAPLAAIVNPPNGAQLRAGQTVIIESVAWDHEDGQLTGSALTVRSDRDGALGSGTRIAAALSTGTHVLTVTAKDSDNMTSSASVTVTVGQGGAPLAVALTANPATGPAPLDVALTAAISGGVPPYDVSWSFGDGSDADGGTSHTHTYASPGTYEAAVTVRDSQYALAEDTAAVTAGTLEETHHYLIPTAAHAPGALGTHWVTDVVLHNPGSDVVFASLHCLERGKDNSSAPSQLFTVPAGASLKLADVVLTSFGASNLTGALRVGSTGPLVVSSRTFNDAPAGTYGQFVPGLDESEAIPFGVPVRLLQLTRNAAFRTNIGFAAFASTDTKVRLDLYRADGTTIGGRTYTLHPVGNTQANDVLAALGADDVADAYAVVRGLTEGNGFFTYASVVDNGSGDPVYVSPAESAVAQADPLWVATAANLAGLNQTRWTTDLQLHNPGTADATVRVDLLKRDRANPSPASATVMLSGGESRRVANPLQDLFAFSGAAALRLTPLSGTVAAASRTYNTAATGSFGQFVPAVPSSRGIAAGRSARLVQLSRSTDSAAGFRTNIGFVNLGAGQITVSVTMYRGDGTLLGERSYTLRAFEHRQITDILGAVATTDVDDGFAVLRSDDAGASFLAYASVVDNRSGDPIFVPPVVP